MATGMVLVARGLSCCALLGVVYLWRVCTFISLQVAVIQNRLHICTRPGPGYSEGQQTQTSASSHCTVQTRWRDSQLASGGSHSWGREQQQQLIIHV